MKRLFATIAIVALALASFGQINVNGRLLNIGDTITFNGKVNVLNDSYQLVDYEGPLPRSYNLNKNSSYYFNKASKNLTRGFVFSAIGATVLATKYKILPVKFEDNLTNPKDKNEGARMIISTIGIIATGIGVLELIIGAKRIEMAAWCLNKERQIYLSPSKTDLGVNIRF